jgi:hypothetical protein
MSDWDATLVEQTIQEDDMVGTLEAEVALGAADRCDRCGAQAVARATLASGSHLLFCGHHLRACVGAHQPPPARSRGAPGPRVNRDVTE